MTQCFVFRTSFQLRVGVQGIHVVNDDGVSLDLSTHAQDLEDFILSQVRCFTVCQGIH